MSFELPTKRPSDESETGLPKPPSKQVYVIDHREVLSQAPGLGHPALFVHCAAIPPKLPRCSTKRLPPAGSIITHKYIGPTLYYQYSLAIISTNIDTPKEYKDFVYSYCTHIIETDSPLHIIRQITKTGLQPIQPGGGIGKSVERLYNRLCESLKKGGRNTNGGERDKTEHYRPEHQKRDSAVLEKAIAASNRGVEPDTARLPK